MTCDFGLQNAFPEHRIIAEVGSGLNYKRPKFKALLEQVYNGDISEVCVTHRDRLCRYGFELLEQLFDKTGTRIVVHMQEEHTSPESELTEDLLAVVTYFVAQNNGRRAAKKKRARKAAGQNNAKNQTATDKSAAQNSQ